MIYYGYEIFSKNLGNVINNAMQEFNNIAGNYIINCGQLTFHYQLICTQNTGTCKKGSCSVISTYYNSLRKINVDSLWSFHQVHQSEFSDSYNTLFYQIVKKNACPALSEKGILITPCETLFGGVLAKGIHLGKAKNCFQL